MRHPQLRGYKLKRIIGAYLLTHVQPCSRCQTFDSVREALDHARVSHTSELGLVVKV